MKVRLFIFLSIIFCAVSANAANRDYYFASDPCAYKVDAFGIGEKIAYGDPIARQYENLLYGHEFNYNDDVIEPFQLAYAFYVIANRVGDLRGKSRMDWAENYLQSDAKDRIRSAIFRKYSLGYLKKCFQANDNSNNHQNYNDPQSGNKQQGFQFDF